MLCLLNGTSHICEYNNRIWVLSIFSLFLKLGHIQVGSPRSFGSGSYACMALVRFPLFPSFYPFSGKCLVKSLMQRVGLFVVRGGGGGCHDHLMLSEIAVLFSLFIFVFLESQKASTAFLTVLVTFSCFLKMYLF